MAPIANVAESRHSADTLGQTFVPPARSSAAGAAAVILLLHRWDHGAVIHRADVVALGIVSEVIVAAATARRHIRVFTHTGAGVRDRRPGRGHVCTSDGYRTGWRRHMVSCPRWRVVQRCQKRRLISRKRSQQRSIIKQRTRSDRVRGCVPGRQGCWPQKPVYRAAVRGNQIGPTGTCTH